MTNCRIMHYEIHPRAYMAPRRNDIDNRGLLSLVYMWISLTEWRCSGRKPVNIKLILLVSK